MKNTYIFTSESVTEGHPDKIADQIADAILDEYLAHDKYARVACECLITTGLLHITGEISSSYRANVSEIARKVIKEIGYTSSDIGLDYDTFGIITSLDTQSPDIAQGVDKAEDDYKSIGAGDQGMMFGYACTDTAEYMPLAISLAHKLAKQLSDVRKCGNLSYLRPDGKTQVSVKYEAGKVIAVDTIVISAQHNPEITQEKLREDIIREVITPVVHKELLNENTKIYINPTGRFVIGGPKADSGLTGRKIIVDTYGGYAPHGGGAFSGKDATKVDRSAAYMARYIAKNLVAAGVAERLGIQIAYAIGRAEPVSININTHGTSRYSEAEITKLVLENFDLRPEGVIEALDLRKPIFRKTASYGHFGRADEDFTWERLDKVGILREQLKNMGN